MRQFKTCLLLGLAALACAIVMPADTASAQVPVVVRTFAAAPPPAVVGYVPERRGLIFPRIVYRPVVSYPAPVAVTTYYPPVAVAPAPVTYYYAPPAPALVVRRPFFGY